MIMNNKKEPGESPVILLPPLPKGGGFFAACCKKDGGILFYGISYCYHPFSFVKTKETGWRLKEKFQTPSRLLPQAIPPLKKGE